MESRGLFENNIISSIGGIIKTEVLSLIPVFCVIGLIAMALFILKLFLFFLRKHNLALASMKMIDKMEGADFEKYLAIKFGEKGYKVKYTPATGDQGADLIIEKGRKKTAVQAKRYNGSVGNNAVQEVLAGMAYYDCDNALVVTNSKFTPAAVKLADKTNVELWDRKKLKRKFHISS